MAQDGSYDAVVVGAGLGGLSTAAFLSTNGRRTLVLEQNQVVGGSSQVFRRQGNKYEFDVGVHYIGDCAPGGTVDRLMRGLGLQDRIEFAELDPDGFSTITLPTVSFRVPRGWQAYEDRLVETFPTRRTACAGASGRCAPSPRRSEPSDRPACGKGWSGCGASDPPSGGGCGRSPGCSTPAA